MDFFILRSEIQGMLESVFENSFLPDVTSHLVGNLVQMSAAYGLC